MNQAVDSNVVDRATRDRLCDEIHRILNDEPTELDFAGSQDPAARFVAWELLCYLDAWDPQLDRARWDYLQRLLLLLQSDCLVETDSSWHWSWRQLIGLLNLTALVLAALAWGWSVPFFAAVLAFSGVTIAATCFPMPQHPQPLGPNPFPFATMTDLETVYHAVAFRKIPFPRRLRRVPHRSQLLVLLDVLAFGTLCGLGIALCVPFWAIALLIPKTKHDWRVAMPQR